MPLLLSILLTLTPPPDTIKCYVQVMQPASDAWSIGRNMENNGPFLSGGLIIYTKAYAVIERTPDSYKVITVLDSKKKREVKNMWRTKGEPIIMEIDW